MVAMGTVSAFQSYPIYAILMQRQQDYAEMFKYTILSYNLNNTFILQANNGAV